MTLSKGGRGDYRIMGKRGQWEIKKNPALCVFLRKKSSKRGGEKGEKLKEGTKGFSSRVASPQKKTSATGGARKKAQGGSEKKKKKSLS